MEGRESKGVLEGVRLETGQTVLQTYIWLSSAGSSSPKAHPITGVRRDLWRLKPDNIKKKKSDGILKCCIVGV